MKFLKNKADKSKEEWKKREQEYETLILEISELKKEIESIKEQIIACDENLKTLREKHENLSAEAKEIRETVKRMQQEVKAERSAIAEKNKDVQKKIHKKEQITAQITELELEIKKLDIDVKKLEEECKNSVAREKEHTKKVQNNKQLKEVANLSDKDANDLQRQIKIGQEKLNKLSRTVNAKAQGMFDYEEKKVCLMWFLFRYYFFKSNTIVLSAFQKLEVCNKSTRKFIYVNF